MNSMDGYWLYILECDNGHLYTGYTDSIIRRFMNHLNKKGGARYTRSFRPVRVVRCWRVRGGRGDAMRVEHLVKSMTREQKYRVIERPSRLKKIAGERLDPAVTIETFDRDRVNRAIKRIIKTGSTDYSDPLTEGP